MRILGIIMAYDEADCISNAIRSLVQVCNEVVVFHHGKDCETRQAILDGTRNPTTRLYVENVDLQRIPFAVDGIQSDKIWNHIGAFVRNLITHFDWVIWQAADELLRDRSGTLVSRNAIEFNDAAGIDVIRPLIREFWLTDADNGASSYCERLKYYDAKPKGHAPRAWRIGLTPTHIPIGLHIQDPATGRKRFPFYEFWPEGTRVSNNEWLLDHYPARTEEQFRRKVAARNFTTSTGEQRFRAYRDKAKSVVRSHSRLSHETRTLEIP